MEVGFPKVVKSYWKPITRALTIDVLLPLLQRDSAFSVLGLFLDFASLEISDRAKMKATAAMVSASSVCEAPEALTAVGSSSTSTIRDGRVHKSRHHHPRRDIENEEIQMYLSKLKELVPFMPKNKKLSRLEVIQHVIDYICHLQHTLEAHPAAARIAAVAASATAAKDIFLICDTSELKHTNEAHITSHNVPFRFDISVI